MEKRVALSNEIIKLSVTVLPSYFVKLFNVILSIGVFPASWSKGFIVPIYYPYIKQVVRMTRIIPRANGAKRRSGRKPGARVTNFVLAELKVVARDR